MADGALQIQTDGQVLHPEGQVLQAEGQVLQADGHVLQTTDGQVLQTAEGQVLQTTEGQVLQTSEGHVLQGDGQVLEGQMLSETSHAHIQALLQEANLASLNVSSASLPTGTSTGSVYYTAPGKILKDLVTNIFPEVGLGCRYIELKGGC